MPDPRFLQLDLEDLLIRLTAAALQWIGQRGLVLRGTGTSAEDLAQNAMLVVLNKESLWRQEASEQELFKLLRTIMRRDFLDLVKSSRYKTQIGFDEIPEMPALDGYVSPDAAILANEIYQIVADSPALKDYVDAILLFGCTKREDIAELLEITPRQVSERRAKLAVLSASWYGSASSKKGE